MTRTSSADPAPVKGRATRARKAGCTHFVSLHSDDSPSAHGVEVQYCDDVKDKPLADRIQSRLIKVTGFNDHGNDPRLNLAVLKFSAGPAVLIELGFITNTSDRDYLIQGANRESIYVAIAEMVTT
jgi:N-acetylmuramoyl-L-alanine amidase